ncbi:hypothetical protein N878_07115 [Pseudomonas sp. EGD-AK9]|uniref:hypothetical protein n=1 Tax=Pseudomonas sp. EGD-AK9 TaxID=1386078 RepID=UPI0003968A3D|nr:hypothetical protein [Pseudomonas sp. EGD-AK9]ERI51133.1 hypothetical protein N878_07115 [Pseudomonas sp. EGD-AK9]
MTVSFNLGRYLVALLWHWITPFLFGAIAATVVTLVGLQESIQAIGNAFEIAIGNVAESCRAPPESASPPASVTGQLGLPDQPADFPPVAGDGGETG